METVRQGSATVGVKSKKYAVLVALKRSPSECVAHQEKIYPIDDFVGVSIAGLTSDARLLRNFMLTECRSHRYAFDQALPLVKLAARIGSKSQIPTQRYGRRPFGVGLLIAGYDESGPHIFQTSPCANFFDCKAMAIGARTQAAKTYMQKTIDQYLDSNLEELVKHALTALRESTPSGVELTAKNCSIGVVGEDMPFTIYKDDEIEQHLSKLEKKAAPPQAPADDDAAPAPAAPEGEAAMEQD